MQEAGKEEQQVYKRSKNGKEGYIFVMDVYKYNLHLFEEISVDS